MKKRGLLLLLILILLPTTIAATDYELGKAILLQQIEKARAKNIQEDNLPFLLENKNSTKAVLLIHGFTATPWEMRELGDFFYEKGFTVYGVLLEGHATSETDLKDTEWEQWYQDVVESYDALSLMSDEVYAIGQSTGGALAMLLSEDHDVDGIISLSSPIYLYDTRARWANIVKFFKKYTQKDIPKEDESHYYEERPLNSVAELNKLIDNYKNTLCQIHTPILIFQSLNDTTVNPKSADYLYDNIHSYKRFVRFNTESHVLTKSSFKDQIYELSLKFIDDISEQKDLNSSSSGCSLLKKGENQVQFYEGILQIANVFLSIVAGIMAATMFSSSLKKKGLKSWFPLIIALILFAIEEILGALRSFQIFETAYLTHIVPTFILGFVIWALLSEINNDSCDKKIKKRCKA